ncbi:MAG: hypothetical protein ACLRVQ_06490 [Lachnospiraceae bacterium]
MGKYFFLIICGSMSNILNIFFYLDITDINSDFGTYFIMAASLAQPTFTSGHLVLLMQSMIPMFAFQIVYGVYIYKHFCCASVYYFSRQKNRTRWFIGESVKIIKYTAIFFASYILTAIAVTIGVTGDSKVVGELCIYTFLYFVLYNFVFCMLINLVSIFTGSQNGIIITYGIQMASVFVLNVFNDKVQLTGIPLKLFKLNPASNLVVSWHSSSGKLGKYINMFNIDFDINVSLIYFFVLSLIITGVGGFIINKIDVTLENKEEKG